MMSAETIEIRDATTDDAPGIAAIYAESIERRDATLDARAPSPAAYAAQLGQDRSICLVAVDRTRIVAWSRIKPWSDRAGYATTGETSIFVARSHSRRGLGRRLYRRLIDSATAVGYHHLVARMFAHNVASVALHRAVGFEAVGVQREVGRLGGRWVDVAIMQRLSTTPEAG